MDEGTAEREPLAVGEREIVEAFVSDVSPFARAYGLSDLRLYAHELPCFTPDGTKYADVVLEVAPEGHVVTKNQSNPTYVLEFKKDKVDYHSAVYQTARYVDALKTQLHREHVEGFVVAPGFSEAEKEVALEKNVKLCSFDHKNGRVVPVQGEPDKKELAVARAPLSPSRTR